MPHRKNRTAGPTKNDSPGTPEAGSTAPALPATSEEPMEAAPEEPREYPRRPFVGVGVVVFRGDDVLLIRRGKPPKAGEWSLPGGSQNVGETVRETAAREVREETGVEIGEPEFLEVLDAIMHDDEGRVRYHYTLIDFYAEWDSGDAVADDDATHAEWIALSRLEERPIWSKTVEIIRKAHAQRLNPDRQDTPAAHRRPHE